MVNERLAMDKEFCFCHTTDEGFKLYCPVHDDPWEYLYRLSKLGEHEVDVGFGDR